MICKPVLLDWSCCVCEKLFTVRSKDFSKIQSDVADNLTEFKESVRKYFSDLVHTVLNEFTRLHKSIKDSESITCLIISNSTCLYKFMQAFFLLYIACSLFS